MDMREIEGKQGECGVTEPHAKSVSQTQCSTSISKILILIKTLSTIFRKKSSWKLTEEISV